jgi:hypothetical protein
MQREVGQQRLFRAVPEVQAGIGPRHMCPVGGVQARMRSEQEGREKRDYQQKCAMHDDFTGSDA